MKAESFVFSTLLCFLLEVCDSFSCMNVIIGRYFIVFYVKVMDFEARVDMRRRR